MAVPAVRHGAGGPPRDTRRTVREAAAPPARAPGGGPQALRPGGPAGDQAQRAGHDRARQRRRRGARRAGRRRAQARAAALAGARRQQGPPPPHLQEVRSLPPQLAEAGVDPLRQLPGGQGGGRGAGAVQAGPHRAVEEKGGR
eukprot:10966115-Alexandrium_andersonii.AAC.1